MNWLVLLVGFDSGDLIFHSQKISEVFFFPFLYWTLPNQLESDTLKNHFLVVLDTLKKNPPKEFAGKKVIKIETLDGFKLTFEDESWILLRASGTEPLVRTYAEAKNVSEITKMLDAAEKAAIS